MYLRPHRELNAKATAAVFLLLLATFSTVQAEVIAGRVVGVSDGDSITVLDTYKVQHKIRLAGIDAPEKAQAFGNRSKESLSDLVGKVLIDGKDANLLQVERGFAWHYKAYESEQSPSDRMLYDLAEREARAARRGLWRDSDPMAPWDFRKEKRRE
jgi:endonuclease YncB( thermonuclease family)